MSITVTSNIVAQKNIENFSRLAMSRIKQRGRQNANATNPNAQLPQAREGMPQANSMICVLVSPTMMRDVAPVIESELSREVLRARPIHREPTMRSARRSVRANLSYSDTR